MKTQQFLAAALAVATLAGTSAFAESRPSNETRRRDGARESVRRERAPAVQRGDSSRNSEKRSVAGMSERSDRSRGGGNESYRRGDASSRGGNESYRRGDASSRGGNESYRRGDASSRGGNDSYRRGDSSRGGNDSYRRGDSSRGGNDSYRRGDSSRGNDSYRRGDSRNNGSYGRGDSRYESQHRSYGNRQAYHHRGRISRHERWGDGYRVWVIGAPYPFYVPLAHWHRDRFRIGLTIGIGGYYNPGGYYDYYDGYYDGYNRSYSRGVLRGVVESVDYRRDTFVVRNEATGSFVTVYSRDRRTDVRAGDVVELEGDWTRNGVFTAYDVDFLDRW